MTQHNPYMQQQSAQRDVVPSLILLLACLWGALLCWLLTRSPLDDAYIFFRYAENFLLGRGFVYNLGDPVEGYSSFLWLLLVTIGRSVTARIDIFAQGASISFYLATIALLWQLSRKLSCSGLVRFLPLLLFCSAPAGALWAGMALETACFGFCILALLYSYLAFDSSPWQRAFVGLVGCCVALCRPEGIGLYVGLLIFDLIWELCSRKRVDIQRCVELGSGIPIFLFYLSCRHDFYGFFMPNTYYAKVGHTWSVWANGTAYLVLYLQNHILSWALLPVLITYGAIFRRDKLWWCSITLLLVYFGLVIQSGGNNWPFWRYAVPATSLLAIVTGEFLAAGFRLPIYSQLWNPLVKTVLAFWLTLITYSNVSGVVGSPASKRLIVGNNEFHKYAKLYGLLFRQVLDDHQSIALNPIPFVGYYFGGYTYDMLGLTDRTIAHRSVVMGKRAHSHEKGDGQYIMAMRPTVIRLGGGLSLPESRETEFNRSNVYFLGDIELIHHPDFERLYHLHFMYIPAARRYLQFYRLQSERVRSISSETLNHLYHTTVGDDAPSIRDTALDKIRPLVEYLDSSSVGQTLQTLRRNLSS